MQRALVWPWHGLLENYAIKLRDGSKHAYNQPLNFQSAQYGSGDTHKIVVKNIAPLTEAEMKQAPAGGEYWAGKALITAGSLYDNIINGWIYQAADGTRWKVSVLGRTLTDTSATLQLSLSLFGEFGKAPESHSFTLSVPVGRLASQAVRVALFADLGPATASVIRLHSVSETGRTAVFAWMAYNDPGQDSDFAKILDVRPRAYMFYKVSIKGSHATLSVIGEILYGSDAIVSETRDVTDSTLRCSFDANYPLVESKREPYFDSTGAPAGEKVTYDYDADVNIITMEGGQWRTPSSWVITQRWMVMVYFDGEEPKPCYLTGTDTGMVGSASFQRVTDVQQIHQEYPDGSFNVLQDGQSHVVGGGASGGTFVVKWEGAKAAWAAQISYGASYHTIGTVQTTVIATDDSATSGTSVGPFSMEPVGFGLVKGSIDGRVPQAQAGAGYLVKYYQFILYSNNMVGVSLINLDGDQNFIGYLTPEGFTAKAAPYPSDDVRHFGSYNPFTDDCVIGSQTPVNWV